MSKKTTERPSLVLYHAGCIDGFTAAWVAQKKMPDAEPVAVQYGTDELARLVGNLSNFDGREVYVLDFSLPLATLRTIAGVASKVVQLDHHKSAEAGFRTAWDYELPAGRVNVVTAESPVTTCSLHRDGRAHHRGRRE